ncbi:MAG: hypothetical protein ACJ763_00705 [Bdellovibrionia bacterium]
MLVSITRLRLISWTHLFKFSKLSNPALEQAVQDPNCLAVATYMGPWLTFWTATVWTDEPSMRKYVLTEPHKSTLPWFSRICSEGATTHYETDKSELPQKTDIVAKVAQAPKFFRVEKPTAAHEAKIIPAKKPWFMTKLK